MHRILGTILAAAALCAAIPARAQAGAPSLCPQRPAVPIVNVRFVEKTVNFEPQMDRAALAALSKKSDTPETMGGETAALDMRVAPYHSFVGGLMQADIELWHDVQFGHAENAATGQACLWVEQVDVRLTLAPVIYVASELQQHDCWYRELYQHELKHVGRDRDILQRYTAQMTDGLALALERPADYVSGPVAESEAAAARKRMREVISYPLGVMFRQMMVQRNEWQGALDNPHEYARIARECAADGLPDFMAPPQPPARP